MAIEPDEPIDAARGAWLSRLNYRVITDTSALGLPGALKLVLRDSAENRCENRLLARVPFKLLVSDDRGAMLGLGEGAPAAHSILIEDSMMIHSLINCFETLWHMATPVVDRRDADDLGLVVDEEGRHLLGLLAAGFTDASISRRLGMSERTVQRRIQWLMKHLGADTRFQAGVNAAKRGWF
ncbi:hypothetical protein BBK82_08200 [Lentzea guizhouensis]|uniref:HTH luxR-type domain-containing protein n=2 Tax=Lentzea guizhouensis TaxID=1586287 RepID=A0A1B2HEB4_9PSEU|nr:hypothetical protein BBK82_08200 [Lentzea guizhouensis]